MASRPWQPSYPIGSTQHAYRGCGAGRPGTTTGISVSVGIFELNIRACPEGNVSHPKRPVGRCKRAGCTRKLSPSYCAAAPLDRAKRLG